MTGVQTCALPISVPLINIGDIEDKEIETVKESNNKINILFKLIDIAPFELNNFTK